MLEKIKQSFEKFVEAFTACGLAMVQGDVTILSLQHFITAGKVGVLTSIAYFVTLKLNIKFKYASIWLTGVLVTLADYLIHAPGFPMESLATGAGAMSIAYIYERSKKWIF